MVHKEGEENNNNNKHYWAKSNPSYVMAHLATPSSNYLVRDLVSHTRRVCSLYKKMLRDIDWSEDDFWEGRFKKLQLRAEFDKHKNIKDMRAAKALLETHEQNFLTTMHPYTAYGLEWHPYSKEGIAYGRNMLSPDFVMDNYHPLEKAQYPYYFAKREAMKEEYLKLWKKKMVKPGSPETSTGGHH